MTHKSTKLELKLRQKTITVMTLKGYCKKEIVSHLSISSSTYERDVHKIRQEMTESLRKIGPMDIFVEFELRRRGRTRLLWKIADSMRSAPREKISALNALRKEDLSTISFMQTFGVLKKEMNFNEMAIAHEEKLKEKKRIYKMIMGIKAARKRIEEEENKEKTRKAWENVNVSAMLNQIKREEEIMEIAEDEERKRLEKHSMSPEQIEEKMKKFKMIVNNELNSDK